MKNYDNKYIIAIDTALKSGYYGKLGKLGFIKGHGTFNDVLRKIKYHIDIIKHQISPNNPLILITYEDVGRNHKTTAKLHEYKGKLLQTIENTVIHYKYERFNEINVFNSILGKKQKWLRVDKKAFSKDLYNKCNEDKTDNDDLADAFVLYKYYNEYLE